MTGGPKGSPRSGQSFERSNEFGYANYEIIPTPKQVGTEVHFKL